MSKRDDLEKQARGEMDLFGWIALGLGGAFIGSVKKVIKKMSLKCK